MTDKNLPQLVTFDGEARSGKGTVVSAVKDHLRDEYGYKVMLIDAGQVFRVLGVAAAQAGVDMDNPSELDNFLGDEQSSGNCVQLIKRVYHMTKDEREALIYSNEAGVNSAKVGARPLSQEFKDDLLRKWLADAADEGYEVVLLDGRALELTGNMLEAAKLCDFVMGLYFICDPVVGARRTLGYAATPYEQLDQSARQSVDDLVQQINARNQADRVRIVQPIVRPRNAPICQLPGTCEFTGSGRPMYIIDSSANIRKDEMSLPVTELVARHLISATKAHSTV